MESIIYMNSGLLLLLMFFLHIYADFNLQGIMGQMKQKDWWKKYNEKYQFDYVMPLIGHSFQWSFFIHIPIIIYCLLTGKLYLFCNFSIVCNTFIHAIIDTAKANDKKLNLIQDQFIHILQIILLWAVFCNIR